MHNQKAPDDAGAFCIFREDDGQYFAITGPPNLYETPTRTVC
jgi:hypothetical protein